MRKLIALTLICAANVLLAQSSKHTVRSGETLFSIAKRYNVTISDLSKANNMSTNTGLRVGQVLLIPGQKTELKFSSNSYPSATKAQVHKVTSGESLYGIAKKYGVSVKELQQWNNLVSANVRPGMKLVVNKKTSPTAYLPASVPSTPDTPYAQEDNRNRMAAPQVATEVISTEPMTPKSSTEGLRTASNMPAEYPGIFSNYAASYKIKKVRGAANYLADNTSGNQYLAFYSGVETGSIIRVTNLMNKKTIYVKVVGKTPPADAAHEIVVKLSKKAAEELGAIDEKFLVEVAGYTAN